MSKNLLIIDKKSFLSLIIIFMLIFSAMAPTVLAMEIAEQNYESENPITNNKVIDFSKITSGGVLESDGYNIKKNGSNYTIKFKNLTASRW